MHNMPLYWIARFPLWALWRPGTSLYLFLFSG